MRVQGKKEPQCLLVFEFLLILNFYHLLMHLMIEFYNAPSGLI